MEDFLHIPTAIQTLCPDAEWTYYNNDLETIVWLKGTNPPTVDEIRAQIPIAKAANKAALEAKAEAKATGKAKLAALGLTPDEVNALLS